MTATRAGDTRFDPPAVRTPESRADARRKAPQAAPTRARVTASAAGRPPGTAAPGPRRRPPTTRTGATNRTGPAGRPAAPTAPAPLTRAPTPTRVRGGGSAASQTAVQPQPMIQPMIQPLIQPQPKPQPARRAPLRIVAPPDPAVRTRRRRRLIVATLVGLACAGLFAIVGVRVLLAQGQAPVDVLESKVTAAQAENQRLRLDVASLESPSRIVAEAQRRLAMVPPATVTYLEPIPATDAQPAG